MPRLACQIRTEWTADEHRFIRQAAAEEGIPMKQFAERAVKKAAEEVLGRPWPTTPPDAETASEIPS